MTEQFVIVFMNDASGAPLVDGEEQRMHEAWAQTAYGAGRVRAGAPVADAHEAKSVAVRDGAVLVTDGPFPEFKEWFAGFAILDADSIDHAVEIMSVHPSAVLGRILVAPVARLPWEQEGGPTDHTEVRHPSSLSPQGEKS